MATPKELLLRVLEDLGNEELKEFQWFLQQSDILKDFRAIPKSRLEKADRQDTLDVMVQTYENDAVKVTQMVLSKMNRNDLSLQKQQNWRSEFRIFVKVNPITRITGDSSFFKTSIT
uniref:Pyrin domain-containing protein n=1 Tax=Myripristis murdjan TaxID=586833 RepID=A0A667WJY4_9TELE